MTNHEPSSHLYDVAIIGLSGRFPGSPDTATFWQNLCAGAELISFFTDEELAAAGVTPTLLQQPNYVKAKGALADIDLFDAAFFGYSPREAQILDPQQRVFLECAWTSLEDAGYDAERYTGAISVFAGASINSYFLFNLYPHRELMGTVGIHQVRIASRQDNLAPLTSYKLGLRGPSLTVQTNCSTSLVAVHLACQSLLNRECDMALAGGVAISVPGKNGYLYQEGGIFAKDGHCRTFSAEASGTVEGNGVGVVVLKRLADALTDGDEIYAVIKGTAVNNDGALKVGYTAPGIDGQSRVIAEALALADIDPETIGYIETHGTGTSLGDPIEVTALTKAFRTYTQKKGFCAIGSVKSNIGHLDTAAGVAGLIKTVLALKHQQLPPSLHFAQPNPKIDFAESPFFVNAVLSDWVSATVPRRAGVSSFGIGGTNAHVILEEAPPREPTEPAHTWQLLVLSARTPTALETATQNLGTYLKQYPEAQLADVAHTLQVGRKAFTHRRMLVCQDTAEATAVLDGSNRQRMVTHALTDAKRPFVFMFPGQGTQYVQMAAGLYRSEPIFREQVDACADGLHAHLGIDIRHLLYPTEENVATATAQLQQTTFTQPTLFTIEYALAQLWQRYGIAPRAMIGHSIGEFVAACLAGVFSLEDALTLVATRGRLMQAMPPGDMLSVSLPEASVAPYLHPDISLAATNSPALCVVSGTSEHIAALKEQLKRQNISCRQLHTSHAFHSTMMTPILEPFAKLVRRIQLQPPQIPFVSNVTGTWITPGQATSVDYWVQHVRQTVRFTQGVQTLLADAEATYIEVGPGRTLSTLVRQHDQKQVAITSLRHPQQQDADHAVWLTAMGQAWLVGGQIDWSALPRHRPRRLPLPTYPFARQRYWIEASPQNGYANMFAPTNSTATETTVTETTVTTHERPALAHEYVAPRTETERRIAAAWQALLGVEKVGVFDDFFQLGGHSLMGTQLINRLEEMFHITVPLQTMFEANTVAAQAELMESVQWATPAATTEGWDEGEL